MSELNVTLQFQSDQTSVLEDVYVLNSKLTQHKLICSEVVSLQGEGFVSRGIDVGTIIATLGSAGVLTIFLELVRDFLLRNKDHRVSIKVLKGEKTVELDYSPASTDAKDLLSLTKRILYDLEVDNLDHSNEDSNLDN